MDGRKAERVHGLQCTFFSSYLEAVPLLEPSYSGRKTEVSHLSVSQAEQLRVATQDLIRGKLRLESGYLKTKSLKQGLMFALTLVI